MFGLGFGDIPFGSLIDWTDEAALFGFTSQTMITDFISEAMRLEFESQ